MTSSFDVDRGQLVLSRRALETVTQLGAGAGDPDRDAMGELVAGGIVADGVLHERLTPIASCLARPLIRLNLERVSKPAFRVEGWIDTRLAVLTHLPAGAAEADVVGIPRGMIGFKLAQLMQVGPRPPHKIDTSVEIDSGLLEVALATGVSLAADDVDRLLRAGDDLEPAWLETLAALSRAETTRFHAGVWWNSRDERPTARTLELLDSSVGAFLVTLAPRAAHPTRRIRLRPVTPSQVWTLLCALTPSAEEANEPLLH